MYEDYDCSSLYNGFICYRYRVLGSDCNMALMRDRSSVADSVPIYYAAIVYAYQRYQLLQFLFPLNLGGWQTSPLPQPSMITSSCGMVPPSTSFEMSGVAIWFSSSGEFP